MNLLIPINSNKTLCSLEEEHTWAIVSIDGGKTDNITFVTNKDDTQEIIDYVILENPNEMIEDFELEGIGILVAPTQQSIEDIIEAYMFRELHDASSS